MPKSELPGVTIGRAAVEVCRCCGAGMKRASKPCGACGCTGHGCLHTIEAAALLHDDALRRLTAELGSER